MRYDWTPLWRSTVGFDRLFDVFDEVQKASEDNYPLYNIERLDQDRFQISVALAGFSPDEITLTVEQNVLTIEGRKAEKEGRDFLYRGISARPFKRQFSLADHVEVKNASFDNGLLVIDLVREVPEAMKPRKVAIKAPAAVNQIEAKATEGKATEAKVTEAKAA
jgi:molecular chaperone IbpA